MSVLVRRLWLTATCAALTVATTSCCTTARCLDQNSSPDRERVRATPAKLGVVHNDRVSGPKRDRTDWKYVDLPKPGKLTAQLHWDSGRAALELAVFDVMGDKIQEGRVWGSGGLRAVIAVEDPGRYYVRVRARGKRDESPYALRLLFKADAPEMQCQSCTPGDRKCLGATGYIVCEQVQKDCNAWGKVFSCGAGMPCRHGMCVGCGKECKADSRRCSGNTTYQVCGSTGRGCLGWNESKQCAAGKHCRAGRCVHASSTPVPPPKRPPEKTTVRAKIVSIYDFRGERTLHIEIGDNSDIKPGQTGTVLEGSSDTPLADGSFKISRVAGRYAIAKTKIQELGKNRWVRIKIK